MFYALAVGPLREENEIEHPQFTKHLVQYRRARVDSRCMIERKCLVHIGTD